MTSSPHTARAWAVAALLLTTCAHGNPTPNFALKPPPAPASPNPEANRDWSDQSCPDKALRDLSDPAPPPATPPACVVSVCMAGAATREQGANPTLARFCAKLPGLVQDCEDPDACQPLFHFLDDADAAEALIQALDRNQDGRVDARDPRCRVNVLGYSWGGVNSGALASRVLCDARVAPERAAIDHLITFDPYAPTAGGVVRVPPNVRRHWNYRQTLSPDQDCSQGSIMGPYQGLPSSCFASTRCVDHDYKTATAERYGAYPRDSIGHCSIVPASLRAALHNVTTGEDHPDYTAPPR